MPLNFEPVPVELHVNQDVINEEFDAMAREAGLTKKQQSDVIARVRMEAIMKNPERIRKVCAHIAEHFKTKIEPNGFKGQVVCYDRECCLLYKRELDLLLGEEATTIVMDTNNDKEDRYKEWRRDRDEEAKLLDKFRNPRTKLKLVMVTSKLLTGFDAPILQVMYMPCIWSMSLLHTSIVASYARIAAWVNALPSFVTPNAVQSGCISSSITMTSDVVIE